jgi:hypothetical protein
VTDAKKPSKGRVIKLSSRTGRLSIAQIERAIARVSAKKS